MVSLVTSISLVTPEVLTIPVPVTTIIPVGASYVAEEMVGTVVLLTIMPFELVSAIVAFIAAPVCQSSAPAKLYVVLSSA